MRIHQAFTTPLRTSENTSHTSTSPCAQADKSMSHRVTSRFNVALGLSIKSPLVRVYPHARIERALD